MTGRRLHVGPKQHVVPDGDGRAVQQAAVEVEVTALADGHIVTLRG